jgi:predicted RNase H-like nuclease (RuvC/YqgF family)
MNLSNKRLRENEDTGTAFSKAVKISALDDEIAKLERELEGLNDDDDEVDRESISSDQSESSGKESEEGDKSVDKMTLSLLSDEYRIKPLPKTCLPASSCRMKIKGNVKLDNGPVTRNFQWLSSHIPFCKKDLFIAVIKSFL